MTKHIKATLYVAAAIFTFMSAHTIYMYLTYPVFFAEGARLMVYLAVTNIKTTLAITVTVMPVIFVVMAAARLVVKKFWAGISNDSE